MEGCTHHSYARSESSNGCAGFRCFFAVVLAVTISACGGGGGGGVTPPVDASVDISGRWRITETLGSNTCGDTVGGRDTYELTANQSGNSLTITAPAGTFSGSVSGSTIAWSGSFFNDGGTVNTNVSLSIPANGNTLSGSANWTWSDSTETCSGNTSISGTRLSGGTTNTGGTNTGSFRLTIVNSGSQALSRFYTVRPTEPTWGANRLSSSVAIGGRRSLIVQGECDTKYSERYVFANNRSIERFDRQRACGGSYTVVITSNKDNASKEIGLNNNFGSTLLIRNNANHDLVGVHFLPRFNQLGSSANNYLARGENVARNGDVFQIEFSQCGNAYDVELTFSDGNTLYAYDVNFACQFAYELNLNASQIADFSNPGSVGDYFRATPVEERE